MSKSKNSRLSLAETFEEEYEYKTDYQKEYEKEYKKEYEELEAEEEKSLQKINYKNDAETFEQFITKVSLMHRGFIVHINDIRTADECDNYVALKVVLYSPVSKMPTFGDVTLKISKFAAYKLKNLLKASE